MRKDRKLHYIYVKHPNGDFLLTEKEYERAIKRELRRNINDVDNHLNDRYQLSATGAYEQGRPLWSPPSYSPENYLVMETKGKALQAYRVKELQHLRKLREQLEQQT